MMKWQYYIKYSLKQTQAELIHLVISGKVRLNVFKT